MEVEGALRIFNRSEVLHNLRYTQYLGDGDSKAYKEVLESKPYKDVNIEKLECVGHVEKRMGTRLRALKLKLKGKKLEDKKSLGGRNRLTDAEIDKLQRYYGLAIRNNSGNLSAMKQAIWAIFFHKISTDLNPQHGLCPLGDDSWCGYNRSKLKGLITKLKVLDLLNIQPEFYTCRALQEADHARIRKAEKTISRRTKEARIKNRQLKCRQEDDLADDPSNPSYGSEKLTVWCVLWAGGIIGPYFKNDEGHNVTVNGDRYRAMITNFFIPELNNHDVQELWFQQDSATCHTDRATIELLKDTFGDCLISRFGPVNWPPRSCDLTPLDYFLWNYVKSLVYADKLQTLDHFEATFAVLLPIYGHKCWKKSSKIGRPDWTTSEPAVAVICQKSYLKCNATRLFFE
ncbi:uncharacterized protein TNCV_4107931 [Trichonephila clavipes]|nr:uncharacterized protein TNCV_4107931 [Trichonephila clavipes]